MGREKRKNAGWGVRFGGMARKMGEEERVFWRRKWMVKIEQHGGNWTDERRKWRDGGGRNGLARGVLVAEMDFCHGRDAAGSASKVFRLAGAGGGRIAWGRHSNNVAFCASVALVKSRTSSWKATLRECAPLHGRISFRDFSKGFRGPH